VEFNHKNWKFEKKTLSKSGKYLIIFFHEKSFVYVESIFLTKHGCRGSLDFS
jgi:hypothetical protein